MHVQNYTYCSGSLNCKQWHSKDAEMWKPKSEYVQLFVDLHCRKSIFLILYTNLSVLNLMINQMILCALHHENFNNFLFWHMYMISNNKMAMHMIVRVVKALYLTLATIITFRPFNYLIYINMPCSLIVLLIFFQNRVPLKILHSYRHCSNNIAQWYISVFLMDSVE